MTRTFSRFVFALPGKVSEFHIWWFSPSYPFKVSWCRRCCLELRPSSPHCPRFKLMNHFITFVSWQYWASVVAQTTASNKYHFGFIAIFNAIEDINFHSIALGCRFDQVKRGIVSSHSSRYWLKNHIFTANCPSKGIRSPKARTHSKLCWIFG